MNDIETVSQFFYIVTIIYIDYLYIRVWRYRKKNIFIQNIFIIYNFLIPLYTIFGLLYIFDVHYQSWISYSGWTLINTLFITTDGMLLEYIIRYAKSEK